MYLSVAGWSNSREVRVEGGKVQFEVGMDHNHCPTCASRVRHVTNALVRKDIPHRFFGGGGSALYVELDGPPQGVDLRTHIGRALNIAVR